jgi:hypothetical protein
MTDKPPVHSGQATPESTEKSPKACWESNLLNASQFGFCARHRMTLHCMRLTDHLTLNFNNKMYKATVFLNIEKAFNNKWHPGFLYKLSNCSFRQIDQAC